MNAQVIREEIVEALPRARVELEEWKSARAAPYAHHFPASLVRETETAIVRLSSGRRRIDLDVQQELIRNSGEFEAAGIFLVIRGTQP